VYDGKEKLAIATYVFILVQIKVMSVLVVRSGRWPEVTGTRGSAVFQVLVYFCPEWHPKEGTMRMIETSSLGSPTYLL